MYLRACVKRLKQTPQTPQTPQNAKIRVAVGASEPNAAFNGPPTVLVSVQKEIDVISKQ